MEGRSTEQKANLLKQIITRLNEMFPEVSILSINIREFEMSDGIIPAAQANRILEMGRWLQVNGKAIYDTRPWVKATGITGGFRRSTIYTKRYFFICDFVR